jgi:hypothetical protein
MSRGRGQQREAMRTRLQLKLLKERTQEPLSFYFSLIIKIGQIFDLKSTALETGSKLPIDDVNKAISDLGTEIVQAIAKFDIDNIDSDEAVASLLTLLNKIHQTINLTSYEIVNLLSSEKEDTRSPLPLILTIITQFILQKVLATCSMWNHNPLKLVSKLNHQTLNTIATASIQLTELLLDKRIKYIVGNDKESLATRLAAIQNSQIHLMYFKTFIDIYQCPLSTSSTVTNVTNHEQVAIDLIKMKISVAETINFDNHTIHLHSYYIVLCLYDIFCNKLDKARSHLLKSRQITDSLLAKKHPVILTVIMAYHQLIARLENKRILKPALFYAEILLEQIQDSIDLANNTSDPDHAGIITAKNSKENNEIHLNDIKKTIESLKAKIFYQCFTSLRDTLNNQYPVTYKPDTSSLSLDIKLNSKEEMQDLAHELNIRQISFTCSNENNIITLENVITESITAIKNAAKNFLKKSNEPEPQPVPEASIPQTTQTPDDLPQEIISKPTTPTITATVPTAGSTYKLYAHPKAKWFVKISPELILFLNENYPLELKNLIAMCDMGRILYNSKGKKGFVVKTHENAPAEIKAKDCSRDIRFFGTAHKDKEGKTIFTLDSLRFKHNKGSLRKF